jgi:hypothetical protein
MPGRIALFAAALWWGSLSVIGFLVVPMLFASMPTPAQAGNMAARLFSAQTWVSTACVGLLLLMARGRDSDQLRAWARPLLGFLVGGLLLALLSEFAVAPRIVARENLALWHGLGSGMFLLQWVCAGLTLWRLAPASPVSR